MPDVKYRLCPMCFPNSAIPRETALCWGSACAWFDVKTEACKGPGATAAEEAPKPRTRKKTEAVS